MEKYSVLMTVYYKEKPEWFKIAIDSMLNQTVKPSEFVLVKDGPLTPELDKVIDEEVNNNPGLFKIVTLEENKGSGPASNAGVLATTNELIARLDSDDYSIPTRMERELKVFEEHPELDMVGSNVTEFIGDFKNIVSLVVLPENNDDIVTYSKKRCPFRTSALTFRKQICLDAGNYREFHLCEDFDMFVRMIRAGGKSYNIQDYLTFMRSSDDFYKRRGGIKYLKSMRNFKKQLFDTGYITRMQYYKTIIPHCFVSLMPNFLRGFVYKNLLRKKPNQEEIDKIIIPE